MISFRHSYLLIFILLVTLSCKKTTLIQTVEQETKASLIPTDSVSFTINSKQYLFDRTNTTGVENSQINVKPYNEAIPGRKYAYETAGKFWYGDQDSTMYSAFFGLQAANEQDGVLEIHFNKKYKLTD